MGFDKLNVSVSNAVVDIDTLELNGVTIPRGTIEPEFSLTPAQCCPVAQRQIRVGGSGVQFPGGAWGVQELSESTELP